MADATYPLVYVQQGATELVIQSSGLLSMDGTMAGDGTITIEDGGYLAMPVVADTSSANLSNFGISTIVNNSSAPTTFTLDAPVAGVMKIIKCDGTFGSTAIGYIDAGTATWDDSTERYQSIKSASAYIFAVGMNTTSWLVVHSSGSTASTGAT